MGNGTHLVAYIHFNTCKDFFMICYFYQRDVSDHPEIRLFFIKVIKHRHCSFHSQPEFDLFFFPEFASIYSNFNRTT